MKNTFSKKEQSEQRKAEKKNQIAIKQKRKEKEAYWNLNIME